MLAYLEALTLHFEADGRTISAIRIYAHPTPGASEDLRPVEAAESGYEGIACVDDTARAVSLALAVHERTGSRRARDDALRWMTFLRYMQYPDGDFANFILDERGTRNTTGRTSVKGGFWWSVRALMALASAFRVLGDADAMHRFQQCSVDLPPDCKLHAAMALAELDFHSCLPNDRLRASIVSRCEFVTASASTGYFRDQPSNPRVPLWGYYQLQAVADAGRMFGIPSFLKACRETVDVVVEPDVLARFWHEYPSREKEGVCAYDVSPMVRGLGSLYRATGDHRYSDLALRGCGWFYGDNDAGTVMYDPTTGRCRDGIAGGRASENFGAESSIEAGFAELARRDLEVGG